MRDFVLMTETHPRFAGWMRGDQGARYQAAPQGSFRHDRTASKISPEVEVRAIQASGGGARELEKE